jgi:hypothetical protein
MSSTMKNITVSLVVITLAFGGYYVYTQKGDSELGEDQMSLTQEMLVNTQVFIERRNILDKVTIDTEIFQNPVFRSYKSFTKPILEEPIRRENPFGKTTVGSRSGN